MGDYLTKVPFKDELESFQKWPLSNAYFENINIKQLIQNLEKEH
jgi:hypothetical protein